ncbi:MAG TPA: phosphoribosylanthranilate isomerase [Ktedonobacteraceae bacterium]|nr:phosphoribosylanthranilate isomerase [Ktedonobacteraceae bacterium]
MKTTPKPRVKICCINSIDEARLAIRYGASALGLVSAMPSGPGVIEEDDIAQIAATIPPGVSSVLLTSQQDAGAIIEQQRHCRVNTLQIVDHFPIDGYMKLRDALPGVALVQVIHVMGETSIDDALAVAPYVNAILLDSGNQSLVVKELGGTGRIHDWAISRRIREVVPVPVFLAGGLHAGNVAEAIATVQPFALDVCSGVRTGGKLDEKKLASFFAEVASTARTPESRVERA